MSDQTIHAFFTRDITDAGTEQRFKKDDVLPLDAGIFGNYEAAGIVRAATEEEIKAASASAEPVEAAPVAAPSPPVTDTKAKGGKPA